MTITNEKTIKEVVKEFNAKFPYLRITFYEGQHLVGEGNTPTKRLDSRKTVGDLRSRKDEGEVTIEGDQKIKTLERNIYLKYGFTVQIFRKIGELWLPTSTTTDRTLEEVNERCSEAAESE